MIERRSRRGLAGMVAALVVTLGCGGDNNQGGVGPDPVREFRVAAGGNNVPDRYSSDLWVHGSFAYTGTWGASQRNGNLGNQVKIWSLDESGAPSLVNSIEIPSIRTVSDIEVSDDGALLLFSTERDNGGLLLYSLADPAAPAFLANVTVSTGVHTATFGTFGTHRYVFAARNDPNPALLIFDVTDPTTFVPVASVPIPANYGIHDTYVRDGLAFVFAWNTGVIIYDVGNGMSGGSPGAPQEVSRLVTSANGVAGGAAVHNGWWFHNPNTEERRYLFIGQEGPSTIGAASSGDIHVVDVSNLAAPAEVAFFHLDGAGTHNFWMDEQAEILYAAYYNGGVVALDVSGTLSGNLSDRLIARVVPGGAGNTFIWGVQLANGSLYASDMLSGLWQLRLE
jgi:hypothetical protein